MPRLIKDILAIWFKKVMKKPINTMSTNQSTIINLKCIDHTGHTNPQPCDSIDILYRTHGYLFSHNYEKSV